MSRARTAADLGVPETFNVATHFVDRHVREGRGAKVAIECGDERVTYAALLEGVNRFGSALRDLLEVRPEERVLLLLLDTPAFPVAFFGAIKIGAVPIPTNTLWKPSDYRYVLNDSRARVAVVSEALLPQIEGLTRADVPALRHIVVVGRTRSSRAHRSFADLIDRGSAVLDADPTHRDSPAFWLYSSGSTGAPKGCVHLHHDMVICAELFAKGVLGIGPADLDRTRHSDSEPIGTRARSSAVSVSSLRGTRPRHPQDSRILRLRHPQEAHRSPHPSPRSSHRARSAANTPRIPWGLPRNTRADPWPARASSPASGSTPVGWE